MDASLRTRREFTQTVALLAAAPLGLTAPGTALAADEKPETIFALTEALSGVVETRFGKFLTKEQMLEVQKAIARKQRNAEIMRQVKLKNSDEPAFAFRADV